MNKLIMLVGLPGAGKTTYAEKLVEQNPDYVIHSSDKLREELYGDASKQENNGKLFEELHRRMYKDLKEGKTVIYDATNLSKKRRVHFLSGLSCERECVLFVKDIEECKNANLGRERKVSEEVIENMRRNFSPPHWHEGFGKITIVNDKVKNISELMEKTKGFDQENEHHGLMLDEHLKKTASYFPDEEELQIAAYMHDVGKLFTKSEFNKEGKKDGNCHYYNHHSVSAYEFLCAYEGLTEDAEKGLYIANLIYYHMHPFLSWKQSEKTKKRDRAMIGERMFQDILRLHEADLKAR